MKAFKGCVNTACSAYKKIHYKKNDAYCVKCGAPLQYVCADCWTQLDDDSEKYCILCKNRRLDKHDQHLEAAQGVVRKVGGVAAGIAGAVVLVGKNAKQVNGAVKDIAKVGKDVLKMVKK